MAKQHLSLDIAGELLKFEYGDGAKDLDIFRNFIDGRKGLAKNTWRFGGITDSRLITYLYSQALALSEGLLLHAAGVIKNRGAYIFFGPSGTGKSSVAALSRRYRVLGDDIIAVKKNSSRYRAFSTPWRQGSFIRPSKDLSAEVRAVFFLKQSKNISFKAIGQEEALVKMFPGQIHFSLYTERPVIEKMFFTSLDFVSGIPAYEMEFVKNEDFWPELSKVINGKNAERPKPQ